MVSKRLSFERLFDLLPNLYKPAVIWYGIDERIELSGHVVNMWSSRVAALLDSEIGAPQSNRSYGSAATLALDCVGGWNLARWQRFNARQ